MDKGNKLLYDGVVLFDTPIKITNDRKETIQIFGLLYERKMRERNDLFVWSVQRYITYLMGTELLLNKGGESAPEIWKMPSGNIIQLTNAVKNFIYKLQRNLLLKYRLVEFNQPLDVKDEEHDDLFLISQNPLTRCKLLDNTKISKKK